MVIFLCRVSPNNLKKLYGDLMLREQLPSCSGKGRWVVYRPARPSSLCILFVSSFFLSLFCIAYLFGFDKD